MEDVPTPVAPYPVLMQVKFDNLAKGVYEVVVQSGDESMALGEESPVTYFQLNLSRASGKQTTLKVYQLMMCCISSSHTKILNFITHNCQ